MSQKGYITLKGLSSEVDVMNIRLTLLDELAKIDSNILNLPVNGILEEFLYGSSEYKCESEIRNLILL